MELIVGFLLELLGKIFNNQTAIYNAITKMSERANAVLDDNFICMKVIDDIVPVGVCFVVLYWLINLLKTLNFKDISLEMLIRSFIRLLVGCILVTNIGLLIPQFNKFSIALTDEINTTMGATFSFDGLTKFLNDNNVTSSQAETKEYLEGNSKDPNDLTDDDLITDDMTDEEKQAAEDESKRSVTHTLKHALRLYMGIAEYIIYLLASQLLVIVITIKGYTRAIDIGRKTIFAPILCADVFGEGAQNAALRYIKELFAVFMQQPLIYLIALIGTYLMGAVDTGFAGILVLFGTSGLIFKAGSISEQLFT